MRYTVDMPKPTPSSVPVVPPKVARLSESQVKGGLKALKEWGQSGEALQRTYKFKDFVEAMKFVSQVAGAAEADQHHPDILIRWNLVTLTLTTHDAGGISEKDFALARKADAMAK